MFSIVQKQPGSFFLLRAYIASHLLFLTEHPHKTTALTKNQKTGKANTKLYKNSFLNYVKMLNSRYRSGFEYGLHNENICS